MFYLIPEKKLIRQSKFDGVMEDDSTHPKDKRSGTIMGVALSYLLDFEMCIDDAWYRYDKPQLDNPEIQEIIESLLRRTKLMKELLYETLELEENPNKNVVI